jgi:NTE family protein
MADANPHKHAATGMPLPDQVALVLQGGGALGAFQVGIFEALDEARIEIDWVAGISIGAVNAAIIAGNPCERRTERLHAFWTKITGALPAFPFWSGDFGREVLHEMSAATVAMGGVPGFFRPRPLSPFFAPAGSIDAMSFYDSSPLIETLDALVDWDLLNDGPMRLSVGAVELESGIAARPAADRDRGEIVVGWRPRLEHAAGPCRRQSGCRPAGVPGRSVLGIAGSAADDHGRDLA